MNQIVELITILEQFKHVSLFKIEVTNLNTTFYRIKMQTHHDGEYAYYMVMEFTQESTARAQYEKLTGDLK